MDAMILAPSDSASNGAAREDGFRFALQGPGELARVLEALAAIPGFTAEGVESVVTKWSGAYHDYVKEAVGVSAAVKSDLESQSSSSFSSSPSVSDGEGKQKIVSAASSVVSSAGSARADSSTPGYCYLVAVQSAHRKKVAVEVGPDPTFEALLALPVGCLVSREAMETLYVVGGNGRFHLQAAAPSGFPSLAQVLGHLSSDVSCPKAGSLAAVCEKRVDKPPEVMQLSLSAVLGSASSTVARREYVVDRDYSRFDRTTSGSLREVLARYLGLTYLDMVPAKDDLGLVSKSAASHDARAKVRLRMLEAVGDAAMTHVLAGECLTRGDNPQQYQTARSKCTNNAALSALFVRLFDVELFSFPAGVDPGSGVVGAKTLEAVIGLVDVHFGPGYVRRFLQSTNLLSLGGVAGMSAAPAGWSTGELVMLTDRVGAGGYCYLDLASESSKGELKRRLGPEPTVRELLEQPDRLFSDFAVASCSIASVRPGSCHVGPPGQGPSALGVLATCAGSLSWPESSLGAWVSGRPAVVTPVSLTSGFNEEGAPPPYARNLLDTASAAALGQAVGLSAGVLAGCVVRAGVVPVRGLKTAITRVGSRAILTLCREERVVGFLPVKSDATAATVLDDILDNVDLNERGGLRVFSVAAADGRVQVGGSKANDSWANFNPFRWFAHFAKLPAMDFDDYMQYKGFVRY